MHYAVVRRRAKVTAQHRVIYAIPCNTMTNNQMQYNAMQYHAMQSKTIQYQVKVSGDHEYNPGRPMGGSWDQIWSPGAL